MTDGKIAICGIQPCYDNTNTEVSEGSAKSSNKHPWNAWQILTHAVLLLWALEITSSATEQSTEQAHRDLGLPIGEMDVNQACLQKKMSEQLQNIILKDPPQMQIYCLFHQHQGASSTQHRNNEYGAKCHSWHSPAPPQPANTWERTALHKTSSWLWSFKVTTKN